VLYPDLLDIPVEVFGGYTPAIPPQDLPPGASPLCQDVVFPEGGVTTRGGIFNAFPGSPIPGAAAINGLKTYSNPSLQKRLLIWDSLGDFLKEAPQGTISLVGTRTIAAGTFYRAYTLFGREYQAFYNAQGGADLPRQYDDVNWDRVSQDGPGVSPLAGDFNGWGIAAPPNGTNEGQDIIIAGGASQVGNLVTLKINPLGPLFNLQYSRVGDVIQVTGVPVAGYNGTFQIAAIIQAGLQYYTVQTGLAPSGTGQINYGLVYVAFPIGLPFPFPLPTGASFNLSGVTIAGYNQTGYVVRSPQYLNNTQPVGYIGSAVFGLAASGNGSLSTSGNLVAGLHQVSVAFVTRQGYITKAAPPTSFTASGTKQVEVFNIPIGPANVVARLLLFTPVITPPATTGSFYSLPNGSPQLGFQSTMLISDNTTTAALIDFSDTVLIAGFQANYLFTEFELGECGSVIGYNSRLVWLQERARQSLFLNLSFEGGFSGGYPLGWSQADPNSSGGGSQNTTDADWDSAYQITGDGATATRGFISQPAAVNYLGVSILQQNTTYGVRVRMRKGTGSAAWAAGTVHINMTANSLGTTTGISLAGTSLTSSMVEYTGTILPAQATIPPDLSLQVYVDGTPTNNASVVIDTVEIYPVSTPYNYSTARISYAFNPEAYDGTTGQVQIRPTDGQQLQATFPIRNNLYFLKDHYLCYATDDGVNEPSSWVITEVSATIGCCGPNAVDWTEEWAVWAERSGAYICWGSDPQKINPELIEDASRTGKLSWKSINWAAAYTSWVRIDQLNRRILFGMPVNGASFPNAVFVLDYKWLDTPQEIASAPLVTYSAFTGKILAHGRGRRWTIWNLGMNSMTFAERVDGTQQPFFGNSSGNGKIYQQGVEGVQLSDDGFAINSLYATHFSPTSMEEEGLRLGAHRKLLGYLKWRVVGVGSLLLSVQQANRVTNLRSYTLATFPKGDGERCVNLHGERFSVQFGTNAVGAWFQTEKLIFCLKKEPTIVVRGTNA
jgi:hypothetical protein